MKEHSFLPNCYDEDVLAFNENAMFKVSKFKNALKHSVENKVHEALGWGLGDHKIQIDNKNMLKDGIDCEVLKLGAKGWQKGKVKIRISVEFCPDNLENPESQLDVFR